MDFIVHMYGTGMFSLGETQMRYYSLYIDITATAVEEDQ